LDEYGYLKYMRSYNPMKSSLISMYNFGDENSHLFEYNAPVSNPPRDKIGNNTTDNTDNETSNKTGDDSGDDSDKNSEVKSKLDANSIQVLNQPRLKIDTGNNTTDNTGSNTADNTGNDTADNTANTTGNDSDVDAGSSTTDITRLDAKSIQVLYQPRLKINTGNNTADNTGNSTSDDTGNHTADQTSFASLIKQYPTPEKEQRPKAGGLRPKVPLQKGITPKKEKENVPSNLDEVLTFFKQENYPELEARKFFNHFQSNGWKVGGKTPMKDWHAAATKWMLNNQNYSTTTKLSNLSLNKNKNYGKPL
jgi:hypothetical protein